MRVGDLVTYQAKVHQVLAIFQDADRNRTVRIALEDPARTIQTVAYRDLVYQASPSRDWWVLTVPEVVSKGPIQGVGLVINDAVVPLQRGTQWSPADPHRPGGVVFLNPEIPIPPTGWIGASFLVSHAKSGQRVTIHRRLTVLEDKKRTSPDPKTALDHILAWKEDDGS